MPVKDALNKLASNSPIDDAEYGELQTWSTKYPHIKPILNKMAKQEAISDDEYTALKNTVDSTTAVSQPAPVRQKEPGVVDQLLDVNQDVLATGIKAAGGLVEGIGSIPGLVNGKWFDNPVSRAGTRIKEAGRAGSSDYLKAEEEAFAKESQSIEGESIGQGFKRGAKALLKHPAASAEMIAGSAAFLLPIGGAGAVANATIRGAGRLAKVARTGAALGAGAAVQGGSVGQDVYKTILDKNQVSDSDIANSSEFQDYISKDGLTPDQARQKLAEKYGRYSGDAGALLSMLFQAASPLTERAVSGATKRLSAKLVADQAKKTVRKKIASTASKFALEQVGETAEEVSGTVLGNVAKDRAGSETAWNEGVGQTMASTLMTTPAISGAPAIQEGGFDITGERKKAAANADGTFNRSRKAAGEDLTGEVPRAPVEEPVAPPVGMLPTPVAPPVADPAMLPTPTAPQMATMPSNPQAPAETQPVPQDISEPVPEVTPEAPAPEVAPEQSPVAPPVEAMVPDTKVDVGNLTIEQARAELARRPKLSRAEANRAQRSDRNAVINALERRISWLSQKKKATDPSYGDKNVADATIRKEISNAKRLANGGQIDMAKKIFADLTEQYTSAYGESGKERQAADWAVIENELKKKAKKPTPEDAGVTKKEVKSLPDAQEVVSRMEANFQKWVSAGTEPDIIDTYQVYTDAVKALYPNGNEANEYIQRVKDSLVPPPAEAQAEAPAEVAPEPDAPLPRDVQEFADSFGIDAGEVQDAYKAFLEAEGITDEQLDEQVEEALHEEGVVEDTTEPEPTPEPVPEPGKKKKSKKTGAVKNTGVKVKVKPFSGKVSEVLDAAISYAKGGVKISVKKSGVYNINGSKLDLSNGTPTAKESFDSWINILSDSNITKKIHDGLVSMGDEGALTLAKMDEVAQFLLDKDGEIDNNAVDRSETVLDPTLLRRAISSLDNNQDPDSPGNRLTYDIVTGVNAIITSTSMTPDDVSAIRSILEPKEVKLNDIGGLIILGSLAGGLGVVGLAGYQGYKAGKVAVEKIGDWMNTPGVKRVFNYIGAPESTLTNYLRDVMENNRSSLKRTAARALNNRVKDFIKWTNSEKTQLMQMFKDATDNVSSEDIQKYADKYRTWVEVDGGNPTSETFKSLPPNIQKSFTIFTRISMRLGAELARQGGSPRKNWVARISNQDAMRGLSAEATRVADLYKMLGKPVTMANGKSWKNAAAAVPAGPLRNAIASAMTDPASGILHGFLNNNGEPVVNTEALPNYLRHEVDAPNEGEDAPEPLFPALMEYKTEVRKEDGKERKVLVPVVKSTVLKMEPESIKMYVEAEALRLISEMHDFEYTGGRLNSFSNPRVRERMFRTDGSLTNGREMPYLGDDFYVSDPWEAMPQVIHRQVMGLGRWKYFGRQKEKVAPLFNLLANRRDGKFDATLGIRAPKNGSDNINWMTPDDKEYWGTMNQAFTDIAMGYHASKPPALPFISQKNLDAFVNAMESWAIFAFLRAKLGTSIVNNEIAAMPGLAIQGSGASEYFKTRAKLMVPGVGAKTEDAGLRAGLSDASSRSPVHNYERQMAKMAKVLGGFDQSVSFMDIAARRAGNMAFREALAKYADARDIGWDKDATHHKDIMDEALRLKTEMELLYSDAELTEAIEILDDLGPHNEAELDKIAEKYSREYAKLVSGSSDTSAKSGLFRNWMFKHSVGFLGGVTISMMQEQLGSLFRKGSLTGRKRRDRVASYSATLPASGAAMTLATSNVVGSTVLAGLITRSYVPMATHLGLGAAMAFMLTGDPTAGFNPVSQTKARAQIEHSVDSPWSVAKFTLGSALKGMPYSSRMVIDMLDQPTAMDARLAGFKSFSQPLGQAAMLSIPSLAFPYQVGSTIGGGLGQVWEGANADIGGAEITKGGVAKMATAGGILSPEIGDLKNLGRGFDKKNAGVKLKQKLGQGGVSDAAVRQKIRNVQNDYR